MSRLVKHCLHADWARYKPHSSSGGFVTPFWTLRLGFGAQGRVSVAASFAAVKKRDSGTRPHLSGGVNGIFFQAPGPFGVLVPKVSLIQIMHETDLHKTWRTGVWGRRAR